MKLAKVQLSYAIVTSPQAGVVTAVATNAGQNASPGKTIATVADTNDLFVRVFVPETRIGDVKLGAAADGRRPTRATPRTRARSSSSPREAEFTPSNVETKEQRVKLVYEVRVRLSDTSGVLKAGMPVDVTF